MSDERTRQLECRQAILSEVPKSLSDFIYQQHSQQQFKLCGHNRTCVNRIPSVLCKLYIMRTYIQICLPVSIQIAVLDK